MTPLVGVTGGALVGVTDGTLVGVRGHVLLKTDWEGCHAGSDPNLPH
ncbi:MAG TPA: hypothetical protein VFQ36_16700 [Ktedonobacteraceae bacterium]|nr:hypothetical protein [Ktedonobacteraceae bacterium]